MNKLFLSILTIFTIQGCVLKESSDYYKFKYILSTKITDFKEPTEKLVLQMNDKLLAISPRIIDKYLYVTDFMNIKNLNTTSELGLFLSSEVKSNIAKFYGYKVKELEYMKYFKLDDTGSKLLSRDTKDILNDFEKTYALVGTYVITQRQVILYLKLIEMKSGVVISTTSESIEITDEILEMEKNYNRNTLRPHVVL